MTLQCFPSKTFCGFICKWARGNSSGGSGGGGFGGGGFGGGLRLIDVMICKLAIRMVS
jgi:hypothetical protein